MSKRYLFDLETDNLLEEVTTIHCIVIYDLDTDEVFEYAINGVLDYGSVEEGLLKLQEADILYGHNIICYDLPVLAKLIPNMKFTDKLIDTLNMSRLIYTDILPYDYGFWKHMNKKYAGRHSLKAWGERFKFPKGDFGEDTDWKNWSIPMSQYCKQDVLLNVKLLRFFEERNYSEEAINLEMDFQKIIHQQEQNGIHFDIDKANYLAKDLLAKKIEYTKELQKLVPPKITEITFIPKVNNQSRGYVKGVPFIKRSETPFNPGSRSQIVSYLQNKYNWTPTVFTDKGNPKLDGDVFKDLPFKEAPIFTKYFDVDKIYGRIKNGKASWLNNYRDGKCYGRMITNGAVTGRSVHRVISNVPKVGSFMGEECRSLFIAPPGQAMVGADASRLELVCLAHYLANYDNGAYAREVESGDIHTKNQHAAGLPTRDKAKTFIYSTLYGGGDEKVGSIVLPNASPSEKKAMGKQLKANFNKEIPAYAQLTADIKRAVKSRGWLKGIDGRILKVRSAHSALNMLLQSCGAILVKKANIILWEKFRKEEGLIINGNVKQRLNYHDEYAVTCKDEYADTCSRLMKEAFTESAEYFNLRCRLDADAKIGRSWFDVH